MITASFSEALTQFAGGRKVDESYRIFRALETKLNEIISQEFEKVKNQREVFQVLENLAFKRSIENLAWFKDDYIWQRPHKTRTTKIRYDIAAKFNEIIRYDDFLKSFLPNAELLMMINGHNGKFWKNVEDEIHECCTKKY